MDIDELVDCIQQGKCKSTLYRQEGCPHCDDLKEKLDELGIPYNEQEIDDELVESLDLTEVPLLRISPEDEEDIFIQNDDLDVIKRRFDKSADETVF
jgi:glutaredoxin